MILDAETLGRLLAVHTDRLPRVRRALRLSLPASSTRVAGVGASAKRRRTDFSRRSMSTSWWTAGCTSSRPRRIGQGVERRRGVINDSALGYSDIDTFAPGEGCAAAARGTATARQMGSGEFAVELDTDLYEDGPVKISLEGLLHLRPSVDFDAGHRPAALDRGHQGEAAAVLREDLRGCGAGFAVTGTYGDSGLDHLRAHHLRHRARSPMVIVPRLEVFSDRQDRRSGPGVRRHDVREPDHGLRSNHVEDGAVEHRPSTRTRGRRRSRPSSTGRWPSRPHPLRAAARRQSFRRGLPRREAVRQHVCGPWMNLASNRTWTSDWG